MFEAGAGAEAGAGTEAGAGAQPSGRAWRLSLFGCSYRGVRHAPHSPNWPQGGRELWLQL